MLFAIDRHLPSAPAAPSPCLLALHAMHVPAHDVSQHTPSTQLPLWHWLPDLHVAPFA